MNPTLITDVVKDWAMIVKTEVGSLSASYPAALNNVEVAVAPTTGLITTAVYESTTAISKIMNGLDGIGVRDATYEFEIRNLNPIPAEGVLVLNIPTGITIPDIAKLTLACDSGCNAGSQTFEYSSAA